MITKRERIDLKLIELKKIISDRNEDTVSLITTTALMELKIRTQGETSFREIEIQLNKLLKRYSKI